MKKYFVAAVLYAAVVVNPLSAAITYNAGYSGMTYYTHSSSSSIVSFDWDSSNNLYYQTSTSTWKFGGFYKADAATHSQSTITAGSNPDYAGASVVAIGDYVYYNNSDTNNTQSIWKYGPTTGSAAVASASTHVNWGLYEHNGSLYITGTEGWGTNHVYQTAPDANGSLDTVKDFGATYGSSGPIAFDSQGNMFYAAGYGDANIYKYTASQVSAALAGGSLGTGTAWYNYSSGYATASGGTSMAFDANGNLLLTLTDYSNPSVLVRLDVNESTGACSGIETVLSTSDRIGELRVMDGNVFVASGNAIYQIVPEPSSLVLLVVGVGAFLLHCYRRKTAA